MPKLLRIPRLQQLIGLALVALISVALIQHLRSISRSSRAETMPISQASWQKGTHRWANVAIGGGGYVTGIYLHPLQADLIYAKTDIGGFYRWQPTDQSWLPITDQFSISQKNYYGGESLAFDPQDPKVVYIAVGKTLWEKGSLFKSINQGKTWTKLNLDLPMGGNEEKRWVGERLAVNPFDSEVLLFGSRRDGLWRSPDAGKTWTKVRTFPAKLAKDLGILAIAFDPQQKGWVYANAYGDGIYQSTDAGMTWNKLRDSPNEANRMVVARRTLYVTSDRDPKVSKYTQKGWSDITPARSRSAYNALAVNPAHPEQLMVSLGETPKTEIYQSLNGGATWKEQNRKLNLTVPWWKDAQFTQPWIASLEFDPKRSGRAWLTDWSGMWRTDDVNANPVVWTNYSKGHEEVLTIALVAPPQGSVLVSGLGDVEGFYHDKGLDAFPSKRLGLGASDRGFHFTFSLAYCAKDPLHMVRLGSRGDLKSGATSTNGGLTWKRFATFPKGVEPTQVAMSATNPDVFVVTVRAGQALRTGDRGKTWQPVEGLPKSGKEPRFVPQSLAADTVDGKFYYYTKGMLYRSDDAGETFAQVNTSLPDADWYSLKAAPNLKGEIWLSLDDEGLYRSADGGKTFAQIPAVQEAFLFALGKPPANSNVPALYLYGKTAQVGIFQSLDRGKTWKSMSEPQNPIGNRPMVMEASQREYGLVFIGTNGRGIYYRHLQP